MAPRFRSAISIWRGATCELNFAGHCGNVEVRRDRGLTFVSASNGQDFHESRGRAAAINSALATLVYTPPSPAPDSGGLNYDMVSLALTDPGGDASPGSHFVQNTQISVDKWAERHSVDFTRPQATFTQPPLQAVGLGTPVTFSNANGNAIVISDPGLGNTIVSLSLSVTDGTLKLAEENGVTFSNGANGSSSIDDPRDAR